MDAKQPRIRRGLTTVFLAYVALIVFPWVFWALL
jgi:hypothetical protein